MKPSEIASLSNSRSQHRKERPNRTTNNGDMAETVPKGSEWVCGIYVIREKLNSGTKIDAHPAGIFCAESGGCYPGR